MNQQQLISAVRTSRPVQAVVGCVGLLTICICGSVFVGVFGALTGDDAEPAATVAAVVREPNSTARPEATPTSEVRTLAALPTATATAEVRVQSSEPTATQPAQTTHTPEPPPTETPVPPPTNTPDPLAGMTLATVTNVVDGDTIDVRFDGQEHRIRIIGVDTPETKDPNQPVMCYGAEATAFTGDTIRRAGNEVYLEKDVSETDRYDRLLRYVWLPHEDGTRMLNQELVAQGYAQSSSYPPDVKYQDLFVEAQRVARDEGRGLWAACGEFGMPLEQPTPIPPPPSQSEPPPATGGNCDASYPDVCIPPSPPDLDCGDISHRRFSVVPPDPHRFDNDDDGVGCEGN